MFSGDINRSEKLILMSNVRECERLVNNSYFMYLWKMMVIS